MGVPVGDSMRTAREAERKAVELQWKEYADIYVKNINNISESSAVLRELNGWLADNAFLAGTSPSTVDRQIFDLLYDQISSLSYSEKESVIHLSRWYSTLQMSSKSRKGHVQLSRSLLF
uniref:Nuclear-export cofactor Arc1-like N-terminal domain-containing protein n=1 Tax=Lygus hesperus TaxID=30085 RepID=A0A0K8T6J7_LYGHE